MSGIYIDNMEMPKCCDECFALDESGDYPFCLITQEQRGYTFRTREKRMDRCPLFEVPEHGRLIDGDALVASFHEIIEACREWANEIPQENAMYTRFSQSLGTFIDCTLRIKNIPTIIPADKEEQT